ncbi:helix-turn-helix domain-containing protein [Paracoccus sediminicola]|uniref:helix-turn-helix domain-containing protein n=1 Tax=Paracoccus sediminicola TaxID=3017783 RepID=UPI0022EFF23A|nr:helix-turn-helix domain-containing protein [Paracoccus sediminicola]WBU55731.1 helix-turn-helix domain-containing protein [Paracoccus sediminicola]
MAQSQETCAETQVAPSCRVWNTDSVRQPEAFDFYREGICAAFMPLRPELDRDGRKSFMAELRSHQLNGMVLNIVSASTHQVHRGRREIATSDADCFYINTQLKGECHIEQRGQSVTLGMGDVGIFDGAEIFDLRHHHSKPLKVASLMVPKPMLTDTVSKRLSAGPAILSRHAVFGQLLSEAGRTLDVSSGTSGDYVVTRLSQIVLSLASMIAQSDPDGSDPATRRLAQVQRIRQIIRHHCTRQDFDLLECAARMGLSVGYLRQILARNGERFGALLLEERLAAAARWLLEPEKSHLSVSSIAYEAGFKDTSHFGRTFRRKYAQSPGEWRQKPAVLN